MLLTGTATKHLGQVDWIRTISPKSSRRLPGLDNNTDRLGSGGVLSSRVWYCYRHTDYRFIIIIAIVNKRLPIRSTLELLFDRISQHVQHLIYEWPLFILTIDDDTLYTESFLETIGNGSAPSISFFSMIRHKWRRTPVTLFVSYRSPRVRMLIPGIALPVLSG